MKKLQLSSLSILLLSLLASCGAPGPVSHVDFNAEFADTANVKSTPKDYGTLQEKEYRDVVLIEKNYSLDSTTIGDIDKNATTTAPADANKKDYELNVAIDTEAKFEGADSLLNASQQEVTLPRASKSCSDIKVFTTINGIKIQYTAAIAFYNFISTFEAKKIACEVEVKEILNQLSSQDAFKFSYLHLPAKDSVRKASAGVRLQEKTLAKTIISRRLYKISAEMIKTEFDKFEDQMQKLRTAEEELAITEMRAPVTQSGIMLFPLDSNPPQLSDLSLQLNGIKREKFKDWKQGVYDPVSRVIGNTFIPLIFLPMEMLLQGFLRPLGAKPTNGQFFLGAFEFQECKSIYIDTSLSGVEIKLDDLGTQKQGDACQEEMLQFFANDRALKFDYIEAAPLVESP